MDEVVKIELTMEQLTVVMRALSLMAQQHFTLALECNNEKFSERNLERQEEYDAIFALIHKQVKDK